MKSGGYGLCFNHPTQTPTWGRKLDNHLNPNVLYTILGSIFIALRHFFFKFTTLYLSNVRLDRHTLWQVLFVCRLFERLANLYDCEGSAWWVVSIILQFFGRINKTEIQ